MNNNTLSGGCLCRAVRFEIRPPLRDVVACHCTQCRKSSGHYLAATAVCQQNFKLLEERGLRWFESSATAHRGFCYLCGSSLFWRPASNERISVFAGSLDDTAGLRLGAHIFTADKGDYYQINDDDDVEQHAAGGLKLEF